MSNLKSKQASWDFLFPFYSMVWTFEKLDIEGEKQNIAKSESENQTGVSGVAKQSILCLEISEPPI